MFKDTALMSLLAAFAIFAGCLVYAFHVASEAAGNALARVSSYQAALPPEEAPEALQPRLKGLCGGAILYRVEEDQFPAGCDWIEAA